jgi:predicted RNA-binding protein YlqC (UPF0109 family)
MKKLIKYIAQALVDSSDQVDVQEIRTQQTLVVSAGVNMSPGNRFKNVKQKRTGLSV